MSVMTVTLLLSEYEQINVLFSPKSSGNLWVCDDFWGSGSYDLNSLNITRKPRFLHSRQWRDYDSDIQFIPN